MICTFSRCMRRDATWFAANETTSLSPLIARCPEHSRVGALSAQVIHANWHSVSEEEAKAIYVATVLINDEESLSSPGMMLAREVFADGSSWSLSSPGKEEKP